MLGQNFSRRFYLLTGLMFLSLCFSFVFPLLGPLLAELGRLDPVEAALAIALIALINGLCQPALGAGLDRGNVALPFLVSTLGVSGGLVVLLRPPEQPWGLMAGLLALAIGTGTMITASRTLTLGSLTGKQREEAAAFFFLVFNLAISVAALVARALVESHRGFLIAADLGITLLVTVIIFAIAARALQPAGDKGAPFRGNPGKNGKRLAAVVRKNTRSLLALFLLGTSINVAFRYFPLLWFSREGDPGEKTALMLLINTVGIVLLSQPLNVVLRRLPVRVTLRIAALFFAGGLFSIAVRSDLPGLIVGTVLLTIGEVGLARVEMPLIYEGFRQDEGGLASGFTGLMHALEKVAGPLIAAGLLSMGELASWLCLLFLPLGVFPVLAGRSVFAFPRPASLPIRGRPGPFRRKAGAGQSAGVA